MPKLSRRHVLLGATAGLVACRPNPTLKPTPTLKVAPSVTPGWHDGLPEAPIRQSEPTAICDIAPPRPRLIVAADDSHVAKVIGGYISQAPTAIWWGTGEFATTFDAGDGTADRWLPGGTLLFAVGSAVVHFRPSDKKARFFSSGHALVEPECGGIYAISELDYSATRNLVLTSGADNTLRLFELGKAEEQFNITPFNDRSPQAQFLGDQILIGGGDSLLVLDLEGNTVKTLPYAQARVITGGDTAVLATNDTLVLLDGTLDQTLSIDLPHRLLECSLTPDGGTLVYTMALSDSEDRQAVIIDVPSHSKRELPLPSKVLDFVTATPNGRLLGIQKKGDEDGAPVVLDPTTGAIKEEFAKP